MYPVEKHHAIDICPKNIDTSTHRFQGVNYHFCWIVRRRRKVLTGSVKQRLDVLIHDVARELDCEVLTLAIEPEHVHLFINSPPDIAPSKLMHRIKGRTARFLRKEFPELMKLPSMWTRAPVCIYGW